MLKEQINIISLGCSKNLVDTELLMGQLEANNYTVSCNEKQLKSSILIINTCGFIGDAKEESVDTILRCIEAKKRGWTKQVFVMGCMTEKYKDEMVAELPEVDAFFGKFQGREILAHLKKSYKQDILGHRILTTPSHYAYLKISEGCNRKCSFCAIPSITGKHTSKPIEELVTEAKLLARKGVKELLVIAQDLSSYGLDIYGKQRLADLLEELVKIEGIEWIKLHYAYPTAFPYDILPIMAKHKKICKYLDIALQHSSNNILKQMRRGITRQKTEELLARIRKEVPGIAIRTTLMVGHPGETQEDFDDLIDFIKQYRFERLGAFAYSHEDSTYAFDNLTDNIPSQVKMERLDKLMYTQQEIAEDIASQHYGKTLKVIIDREQNDFFIGRTQYDSPEVDPEVYIKKHDAIEIGSIYDVEITETSAFELTGKVIIASRNK